MPGVADHRAAVLVEAISTLQPPAEARARGRRPGDGEQREAVRGPHGAGPYQTVAQGRPKPAPEPAALPGLAKG